MNERGRKRKIELGAANTNPQRVCGMIEKQDNKKEQNKVDNIK